MTTYRLKTIPSEPRIMGDVAVEVHGDRLLVLEAPPGMPMPALESVFDDLSGALADGEALLVLPSGVKLSSCRLVAETAVDVFAAVADACPSCNQSGSVVASERERRCTACNHLWLQTERV